jgi:predicted SAM-dependent methyltransferase
VSTRPNTVQRVGGELQRLPVAYSVASLAIQTVGRMRRERQIAAYLQAHERRYLRIGSGSHTDRGWLSTDLLPVGLSIVFMDATRRFPLPSGSFDVVQCEHVIEHVPFPAGLSMLRECHRVLRTGGILRIATPDIDLVRRLLDGRDHDAAITDYAQWSNRRYGTTVESNMAGSRVLAANRLMRNWGHTFLYDEVTLRGVLADAEFDEIVRVAPGESAHPALAGVDRHEQEIGRTANELETLVLEAKR